MKKCTKCGEEKPLTEFRFRADRPSGVRSACKPCENIRIRIHLKEDPRRRRDRHLRYTYGISSNHYNVMLKSQGERCLLCGKLSEDRLLVVDHNHKNGEARGLICSTCNIGLGFFKDDPNHLRKAVKYLEFFEISTTRPLDIDQDPYSA